MGDPSKGGTLCGYCRGRGSSWLRLGAIREQTMQKQQRSSSKKNGLSLLFALLILIFTAMSGDPAQAQLPAIELPGGTQSSTVPELPDLDATAPVSPDDVTVEVEAIAQFDIVTPGQQFPIAVSLTVSPGWHLYANPKQGEFGQDTVITASSKAPLRFAPAIYPPGEPYADDYSSNHIYQGTTVCHIPVEIPADAEPAKSEDGIVELDIQLNLVGQLCGEAGVCKQWESQAKLTLKVAAEPLSQVATRSPAMPNRPELFEGVNPADAWRKAADSTDSDLSADAEPAADTTAADIAKGSGDGSLASDQWFKAALLALLAGVIMNLMPCVLPIIPIIVMTLINQCTPVEGQKPDRGKSIRVGLAFAAGIMIVFAGLAVVMAVFKLLWGQQFQGNGFKFALLMIVYVLSLSMFGLFEIALPSRISNITVVRKGYLGAFAMGMLATVLATPCGAPLLTPVLAWSAGKPLPISIAVFLIVGAGMAAPYVLLTTSPGLINRIPKAGNWMIRLKQAIGFLMLAFAIWLIMLFPPGWQAWLLYLCVLIGFAIWLGLYVVNRSTPSIGRFVARGVAVLLLVVGLLALVLVPKSDVPSLSADPSATTTYDTSTRTAAPWDVQLADHIEKNQTVIVKVTANWCKNCSVLDRIIYKTPTFRAKLAETDTALVIADWSQSDPAIKRMLNDLGGRALPFAAVFPAGHADTPIILRDFYSLDDTLSALDQAARRAKE